MSNISKKSQCSKLTSFIQEYMGKEIDVARFYPNLDVTGLRLVGTAKTVRFLCRLTFQGKKLSRTLGSFSHDRFETEIPKLAAEVKVFNQRILNGLHPFEDKEEKVKSITFGNFTQEVYLPNAEMRKKSYKDDESRVRIHLIPTFGNSSFKDITVGQLNQLLANIRSTGLSDATVNRIRALLSAIFNLAIDHEIIESNPVARVKKFKENNQKERYLENSELPRLMKVLNSPEQFRISNLVIVAAVKFLLLTGVRKREALDLKWSDLDTHTGKWLLGENKSGKARYINLNEDALTIVKQLSRKYDYVFANPETGKPFNDIRKTFDKIMQASDIKEMRIHDLRHNFASLAVNSGQSLYVVQHLLGHASPQTTQRYAHLQSSTLKQASEAVASVIRDQSALSI
mgnify:FL=1